MRRRAGSPADEREGLQSKERQCTKPEHAYCLREAKTTCQFGDEPQLEYLIREIAEVLGNFFPGLDYSRAPNGQFYERRATWVLDSACRRFEASRRERQPAYARPSGAPQNPKGRRREPECPQRADGCSRGGRTHDPTGGRRCSRAPARPSNLLQSPANNDQHICIRRSLRRWRAGLPSLDCQTSGGRASPASTDADYKGLLRREAHFFAVA